MDAYPHQMQHIQTFALCTLYAVKNGNFVDNLYTSPEWVECAKHQNDILIAAHMLGVVKFTGIAQAIIYNAKQSCLP